MRSEAVVLLRFVRPRGREWKGAEGNYVYPSKLRDENSAAAISAFVCVFGNDRPGRDF